MRVPLSSRQTIAENRQLHVQLADLLDKAHRNQQIIQRNQKLDLELFAAGSFRKLFSCLFETLPAVSELDVVTLGLVDENYVIRRALADLGIGLHEFPNLFFVQHPQELGETLAQLRTPLLGSYQEQLHGPLFPEPVAAPASVAIAPLVRRGEITGHLSLGSFQPHRFTADMATDFLEHRASVVAICIENVATHEQLKHIGTTDALTRVGNRHYAQQRLREGISRSLRKAEPLSCLFIDIDHFKRINDTIGHQAGDQVLREVASRIKSELRGSDTVGRFGGEEFIVLLEDTDLEDACRMAERIRLAIADHLVLPGPGDRSAVTISIGVATLHQSGGHEFIESIAQDLIARADEALYRAKAGGRNRVASSR